MTKTALGLAVLMVMGCANTNYGYLYRPKDATVDACPNITGKNTPAPTNTVL